MNETPRFHALPDIDYARHLAAGRRLRSEAVLGWLNGLRGRMAAAAAPLAAHAAPGGARKRILEASPSRDLRAAGPQGRPEASSPDSSCCTPTARATACLA